MDLVEWNRIPQVANGINLIVDLDYDIVMPLATSGVRYTKISYHDIGAICITIQYISRYAPVV